MTCDECGRVTGHTTDCSEVAELERSFMQVSGIHVTPDPGAWARALERGGRDDEGEQCER